MSEHDSESGGGRRGFVRDVMGRLSPADEDEQAGQERVASGAELPENDAEGLQDAIRFFGSDSNEFRTRLDRMLGDFET